MAPSPSVNPAGDLTQVADALPSDSEQLPTVDWTESPAFWRQRNPIRQWDSETVREILKDSSGKW